MKINNRTRRQFLVGGANVFVALPFLPSLWPRSAWGQALPIQKRFIATWLPLGGYSNEDLYPTYTADTPLALYPNHTIYSTALRISPTLGSISKVYSAALTPYIAKLNMLRGLDCPVGFSHAEGTMLGQMRYDRGFSSATLIPTANGGTFPQYPVVPEIDQFLAYSPDFYRSTPVLRSVVGYNREAIGLIKPGDVTSGYKKQSNQSTPTELFNALFGVSTPPVATSTPGQTSPTPEQTNSKTLIDQVLGDLNSAMKSRNISSTDRQNLDAYTTELHELQKRLTASSSPACAAPIDPKIGVTMRNTTTNLDREKFLELYASVLVAGIKCGRTSVAGITGNLTVESQGADNFDQLHAWTHTGSSDANYADRKKKAGDTMRWYLENLFIPIIKKLDVDEGNGKTFLDNSLVMFGNQNSNNKHRNWDRPILLAGSAGGFLKTGNFVDYRQRTAVVKYGTPGILYNQLIVTILRSMGIPATDPMLARYAVADLITVPSNLNAYSTLKSDGTHPHKHLIGDAGKLLPIVAA